MEPNPSPELADTSVWARSGKPGLEWFAPALEDGRIAVCDQVAMEVLWSARDIADFRATEAGLLACPWFEVEPADWAEARRVFRDSDYDSIASVTGQPTRWASSSRERSGDRGHDRRSYPVKRH
jgi:hypothetical protein